MKDLVKYLGITAALWAIAIGILLAGSQNTPASHLGGYEFPTMALALLLCFAMQWLMFIPAYIFQTEHYYDLTGSITYMALVILAITTSVELNWHKLLLALAVIAWALRLGSFLFRRVKRDGADHRFDKIKPNFGRFFMVWNLQGLWVFLTLACTLSALHSEIPDQYSSLSLIASSMGLVLWLAGFVIEVISDNQKSNFRKQAGPRSFMKSGLWAWSRHPNYFGEILLWSGLALSSTSLLSQWQWLTMISPIFVYLLITRVSGLPMLESKANKVWGDNPDYQAYKAKTPILMLKRPS